MLKIFRFLKLFILLAIIIGIIVGLVNCGKSTNKASNADPDLPNYIKIAPNIGQAPYVLQTSTRVYYVKSYTDDKTILTLNVYYTYDKNTWKIHTEPLVLDRKIFGAFKIYDRKIYEKTT